MARPPSTSTSQRSTPAALSERTIPEDWNHYNTCPLFAGTDTLVGLSPAKSLQQHQGLPSHSHAHQAAGHLFRDPLIKEATIREALTQALQPHLTQHAENSMKAAAHLQLEAVRRTAAQMVHCKRLLLADREQPSESTPREQMMRLIHDHAVHDPDVH